jgi:hypothetical protein
MSYQKLGNDCMARTLAITSNNKHILPDENIYKIQYTNIMQNPLSDNIYSISKGIDEKNPDILKNFYGKYTIPKNCVKCSK